MSKKNTLRLVTLMIAGSMPLAAHSFVDERTQPAPTPTFTPASQPGSVPGVKESNASPLSSTGLINPPRMHRVNDRVDLNSPVKAPHSTPVSSAVEVKGNFALPVWQAPYPGPYGKMPLSNALIAQIVPAVGDAIELDGLDSLLHRQVTVPRGLNRVDTLREVAKQSRVNLHLMGTRVVFSEAASAAVAPDVPKVVLAANSPATQAGAVQPLGSSQPAVIPGVDARPVNAEPLAIPEPKKTWVLKEGEMLSTAILNWAKEWGWTPVWNAAIDYRIAAPITLNETFLDGVGKVLSAYKRAERPLWADWHEQQKVLVINEPNSSLK